MVSQSERYTQVNLGEASVGPEVVTLLSEAGRVLEYTFTAPSDNDASVTVEFYDSTDGNGSQVGSTVTVAAGATETSSSMTSASAGALSMKVSFGGSSQGSKRGDTVDVEVEYVAERAFDRIPVPPADSATYLTDVAGFALPVRHLASDVPGQWFRPDGVIKSAAALSNERISPVPVAIDREVTIDRIGINVTTAEASSTIRLGIYNIGATDILDDLVLDAGTVDSSTTGNKAITISQTLTAGVYIFVALPQGGSASPAVTMIRPARPPWGVNQSNAFAETGLPVSITTYASGGLPDPGGLMTAFAGNHSPLITYRIVP